VEGAIAVGGVEVVDVDGCRVGAGGGPGGGNGGSVGSDVGVVPSPLSPPPFNVALLGTAASPTFAGSWRGALSSGSVVSSWSVLHLQHSVDACCPMVAAGSKGGASGCDLVVARVVA